jgi:hypothetical protein
MARDPMPHDLRPHDLVCASCAGPVQEGRCSVCRAARSQLGPAGFPLWLILALVMLAAVLSLSLSLRPV